MAENLVSPPPQTAPQPPRAAPQPPQTEPQWTGWHTLSLLVSMMLMVLAGVLCADPCQSVGLDHHPDTARRRRRRCWAGHHWVMVRPADRRTQ